MTLLELINILKKIALQQPNIRMAEEGSVYEIMNANLNIKYNTFVISQQNHRKSEQFAYYTFNLFVIDRLVDDLESNRTQAQSMAIESLSNIIHILENVYDIEIESDMNFTTFTEKFSDICAGAYLQATLITENTLYCADGDYIDETKPIKIINQNKTITITENGNYNVTYDKDIYTGIEEVNIDVEVDTTDAYNEGKIDGIEEGIEQGKIIGREETIESLPNLVVNENGFYEGPYKDIEVNVSQTAKINVKDNGIKFGESTFTTVPDVFDFSGVSDVTRMFYRCFSLEQAPLFRTDMVTDFTSIFNNCTNLKSIPFYDTSNVQSFYQAFYTCQSIETIPQFDTSKVIDISEMLGDCNNLKSVPALDASSVENRGYGLFSWNTMENLTDFGGLINLKASIDGWGAFNMTPNLTYESCINILNGLYDFTGNGETPNSNQGRLKVSASFINQLTEEDIQIPIRKGWVIFSE